MSEQQRDMFPTDPEDHLARLADNVRAFEAMKRSSPAEKRRLRQPRKRRRRPDPTDTPQERHS